MGDNEMFKAFLSLTEIYSEIYDLTMGDLVELEKQQKQASEEFSKITHKIQRLRQKEKRVLEKFISSEDFFSEIDSVNQLIIRASNGNEKKGDALFERMNYRFASRNMSEMLISTEYENGNSNIAVVENSDGKTQLVGKIDTINFQPMYKISFFKFINDYLEENDELLNHKYYNSFVLPDLEDELIIVGYNPDNVPDLSYITMAKLHGYDLEKFTQLANADWYSYTNECLENFLSLACNPNATDQELELYLEEALFNILNQETSAIVIIYDEYLEDKASYVFSDHAQSYIQRLEQDILFELSLKDDYNGDFEEREQAFPEDFINPDKAKEVFEIINISRSIYESFNRLWQLELQGKKSSKDYQKELKILYTLTESEKEHVESFDFDDIEEMDINTIITKYLEFIRIIDNGDITIESDEEITITFNESEKLGGISSIDFLNQRLANLLFSDRFFDTSIYKSNSVPHYIVKNYELECIQKYLEDMNKLPYYKECLEFLYGNIFSDPILTEEFILTKGELSKAPILDSHILASLLEIDIDEYEGDREEILKNHITKILADFVKISDQEDLSFYDKAQIDYQTIALAVAVEYVDEEERDIIQSQRSSDDTTLLTKQLNKALKEKPKSYQKAKKNQN